MFFSYTQNNSGGEFQHPAYYVIIEAESPEKADIRARDVGLYFDGFGDCRCCGNRWHETYDDGSEDPEVYGKGIHEILNPIGEREYYAKHLKRCQERCGNLILVYYLDGRQEHHNLI